MLVSSQGVTCYDYLQPICASAAQGQPIAKVCYIDNEPEFRWALCEDEMANDKLNEGIRRFARDGETLKKLLREKILA